MKQTFNLLRTFVIFIFLLNTQTRAYSQNLDFLYVVPMEEESRPRENNTIQTNNKLLDSVFRHYEVTLTDWLFLKPSIPTLPLRIAYIPLVIFMN